MGVPSTKPTPKKADMGELMRNQVNQQYARSKQSKYGKDWKSKVSPDQAKLPYEKVQAARDAKKSAATTAKKEAWKSRVKNKGNQFQTPSSKAAQGNKKGPYVGHKPGSSAYNAYVKQGIIQQFLQGPKHKLIKRKELNYKKISWQKIQTHQICQEI